MPKEIRKIWKNKGKLLILLIVTWQLNFAPGVLAFNMNEVKTIDNEAKKINKPRHQVAYAKKITLTAYSSTPDQTDSTPCITANGYNLCEKMEENVVAANFLPFGTKIRIPKYFGEKIFTVQDRMNARYYYRADIWMKNRQKAINFGIKFTEVEILK